MMLDTLISSHLFRPLAYHTTRVVVIRQLMLACISESLAYDEPRDQERGMTTYSQVGKALVHSAQFLSSSRP